MIEVTNIEETKDTRPVFKNGVYVGDEIVDTKQNDGVLEEIASEGRGLPVGVDPEDIIHNDLEELKAYESNCLCGCNTVVGVNEAGNVSVAAKGRQKVFNSGLKVIQMHTEKIRVDIPREILNACDELQEHVGHNEFSIVCKGAWGDDGNYVIGSGYKVPKQKVDGAAVDYDLAHLEQLKSEGYNSVIHSHPFSSKSFSSSDSETINSHFECSVLYSLREFTTATIAICPVSGMKLIAEGDPVVEGQNIVPKTELDNIEKKFKTNVYAKDTFWYGDYGNFRGAGKQRGWTDNRPYNERGCDRAGLLTREVTTKHGKDVYTYDHLTDTFWKNGVKVEEPGHKRRGFSVPQSPQRPVHVVGDNVRVIQAPYAFARDHVFTTRPQTRIFDSGAGSVEEQKGKKSKGKKDNQPKIELR